MPDLIDRLGRLRPYLGPLARPVGQRAALAVLLVAVIALPLVVQAPPVGLTEGTPAPRTFRANRTVQFIDEVATQSARDAAAEAIAPVQVFDAEALPDARETVTAFFDEVLAAQERFPVETPVDENAAAAPPAIDTDAVAAALTREYPDLDPALVAIAAGLEPSRVREVRLSAEQLVTSVLGTRFTAEELPATLDRMREETARLPYDTTVLDLIEAVVEPVVAPTLTTDPVATEAAREAAALAVDPVVIVKQAGENIVQRGDIVTAEHLEIIKRLGLLEQGGSLLSLIALTGLAAGLVAAGGAYIWRYDRAVWDRFRDLLIIATLLGGTMWVARGVLWVLPEISVYYLPVPLAAMLATLLVNPRQGMLVAVLTSLGGVLLGFAGGSAIVAMLLWSILAVVAVSFMNERRHLFYVGSFIVATGVVLGFTATYASGFPLAEAVSASVAGAVGGTLAAVLGYGLLPFFEHLFGVTTDVRLLELASPANPLLRELMVKAPGTYSHSVMTGNLAEAAAEAIGANQLLARAGAYYHDVGKMRRPGFFVENQAGSENPHDTTPPSLSAIIITAHVREGIELAESHKLPREIVDIIRQHHGTSLVSYFYNKAAEGDGPVYEADFRYDGQRPQTREAALVMLADSAEAAVRAIRKPTLPRIEAVVRGVVDAKLSDDQLDDADLTLADIEKAVQVYSKLLASMYHPRIEYPDDRQRRPGHADQHHEPSRA